MVKINDQAPVERSKFWRGPSRDKSRTPWVALRDSWLQKAVLHPLQGRRLYHLLPATRLPFAAILIGLVFAFDVRNSLTDLRN